MLSVRESSTCVNGSIRAATVFRTETCANSARILNFPIADPCSRDRVRTKELLMIRPASRQRPGACSKLCSSSPGFSGRHYWHRSRGRARGRGRPSPTLSRSSGGRRACNYARTSRIDRAVDSECGNRCPRLERCWLTSGATTVTVTSQAFPSEIPALESHRATNRDSSSAATKRHSLVTGHLHWAKRKLADARVSGRPDPG